MTGLLPFQLCSKQLLMVYIQSEALIFLLIQQIQMSYGQELHGPEYQAQEGQSGLPITQEATPCK
nr:MAG TPA: hypothetical protein [Caudoviricetes sp.]